VTIFFIIGAVTRNFQIRAELCLQLASVLSW